MNPEPPARPDLSIPAPEEIDAAVWADIVHRAGASGADPLDLAICEGHLDEAAVLADLAHSLGVPFLETPPPPAPEKSLERMAALRSYLAYDDTGAECRVIAPNMALAGLLTRQRAAGRLPAVILTTHQALIDAILRTRSVEIAQQAATSLPASLSARAGDSTSSGKSRIGLLAAIAAGLATAGLIVAFPLPMVVVPPLILAPAFLLAPLAVLTAAVESLRTSPSPHRLALGDLPRYSVLVPLYRESNIVEDLVGHLAAIEYPRDRIEVFLLVEEDDSETRQAVCRARLPAWFRVITVPPGEPRTKPRALNVALPFCTGDYVVVYDAEDEPEVDQLLRAAARFREMPADVACLQARLGISNSYDGFLTRRFAIDYAALFDCIKSGSANAGWAVPLGGSSNHFRLAALRAAGAWDAWNVTEDADLGVRLARLGWRVEDLVSTTWEEAPNTLGAWMNQRTRWMKGWIQSAIVHLRAPLELLAALGPFRTTVLASMTFAMLVGSALYPLFLLAIIVRLADPMPLGSGGGLLAIGDTTIIVLVAIALLAEAVPDAIALKRRKALHLLPFVVLAPITHLLTSFAMWRAMVELVRRPYHWHKTMHGAAKHEGRLGSLEN